MPTKRTAGPKLTKKASATAIGAPLPSEETGKPCPICGKPGLVDTRPFCSKRCADVDLHRWLGGTYAIPAVEAAPDDEDEAE
jgi:endogenous inhibitor of DNA gyrase (YacG/DUF329 family)